MPIQKNNHHLKIKRDKSVSTTTTNHLKTGAEPTPEVGLEVLMVVSMKMAVFWVVVPCSLVEVYHRPDDGDSKDLSTNSKLLPHYTELQPRRQRSSIPQTSHIPQIASVEYSIKFHTLLTWASVSCLHEI
jgi:hypothetical protein